MKQLILSVLFALFTRQPGVLNMPANQDVKPLDILSGQEKSEVLASREISMKYRYWVPSVSAVFKDNILLNLAYLDGRVESSAQINWEEINKPFHSEFTLEPGQAFAYHDAVLPEYKDKVVVTSKSRFNAKDGYKTDGYLYGDGVCQLASLINWAASDAKLDIRFDADHDFAMIPEVPRKYGVAVFSGNPKRNLYITNNQEKPVTFHFDYQTEKLSISVTS